MIIAIYYEICARLVIHSTKAYTKSVGKFHIIKELTYVGLKNMNPCVLCSDVMVFRRGKVRPIRWLSEIFPTDVFQIDFNRYCNMRSSVVIMENYCLVSNGKFRTFFGNRLRYFEELLAVAFAINRFTRFY